MKKLILLLLVTLVFSVFNSKLFAQSSYKTAVGLGIDFGDGSTIIGPSIKHFFNDNNVIVGDVLFGDHFSTIGAFYQYHQSFKEAKELKWYLGIGPEVAFNTSGGAFLLRPMVGLDYKIKQAPLSVTLDWRPIIVVGEFSDYSIARFGLGLRYTYK